MAMIKSTTTLICINAVTWNTEIGGTVAMFSFFLWLLYLVLLMVDSMLSTIWTDHRDEEEEKKYRIAQRQRLERAEMAGREMARPQETFRAVLVKRKTTTTTVVTDDKPPTSGG